MKSILIATTHIFLSACATQPKILLKTSTRTLHVVQIKQKTQKKLINASKQIKTQWSYKNIILDGMIRKVGSKARRK